MQTINLSFSTYIVPKKNAFRAGVRKDGTPYQYGSAKAKKSQAGLHKEAERQVKRSIFTMTKKPVELRVLFKKTEADCIGLMETLQDALEGVIYVNDEQVFSSSYRWDWGNALGKNETCRLQCVELDNISAN